MAVRPTLPDLASRLLRRGRRRVQRRVLRRRRQPGRAGAGRCSSRARSGPRGRCTTAGRPGGAANPGTTGPIVRLGVPGVVRGVVVDTVVVHRQLPAVRLGRRRARSRATRRRPSWPTPTGSTLVRAVAAGRRRRNPFAVASDRRFTHVRLTIYPGRRGGPAARARRGRPRPAAARPAGLVDLAALENGGRVVGLQQHVLRLAEQPAAARSRPDDGRGLGDRAAPRRRQRLGRGTARPARRGPAGRARHHPLQGQRPRWATLSGIDEARCDVDGDEGWFGVLPRTRLQPDTRHRFLVPAAAPGPPTSGWTSTPTAAWPACASSATPKPADHEVNVMIGAIWRP